jgi:hypothetical protein
VGLARRTQKETKKINIMEQKTKVLLWVGGGAIAIVGGYLLYDKFKHDSKKNLGDDIDNLIASGGALPAPSSSLTTSKPSGGSKPKKTAVAYNVFPLKYGSKGTTVRDLQTALNKHYGTKIDVDGDWGDQTRDALKAKGLPTTIDVQALAKITAGTYGKKADSGSNKKDEKKDDKKPSVSHAQIALDLERALEINDINGTIRALSKIKGIMNYIKVNEKFKNRNVGNYNKATIPTALNRVFPEDPERKRYRSQLYTIGLKWKNDKWALAGFSGTPSGRLITIERAKVWNATGKFMVVPRSTIIGTFISARNGLTEFQTLDGKQLYINTTQIKYHD